MPGENNNVNQTIAPLRNVALMAQLVQRVQTRSRGIPGLAVFYGKSGYGKTTASIYAQNKFNAYHVQCKSVWTRRKFCSAVLGEMGITATGTLPEMVDMIGEQLSLSKHPLIVDEADFMVSKSQIELVRDIYESADCSVILIGEDQLPVKIKKWERVYGRVLEFRPAVPASLKDAEHLAGLWCPKIEIAPDLLAALHDISQGSVRRICVNLDRARDRAATLGKNRLTLAEFTAAEFFTGEPPQRRAAA